MVKLPEESMGGNFLDSGLGTNCLAMIPKAQATKAKIKWDQVKQKRFHTAKETMNNVKR